MVVVHLLVSEFQWIFSEIYQTLFFKCKCSWLVFRKYLVKIFYMNVDSGILLVMRTVGWLT